MTGHLDLATVDVRARGLEQRLLRRDEVERLAGAADVASLVHALEQTGRFAEPVAHPTTEAGVELAVRRSAVRALRLLASWASEEPALDVFFGDQDRRSLRAMLRGALQGAPAAARLRGLLPTPRLPERALVALAQEPTPARVVAHLAVLRHPDADRLVPLATRAAPVLLELELALLRGFAERTRRAAHSGDSNLRDFVSRRIDVSNVETVLVVTGRGADVDPSLHWVEGGALLGRDAFVEACRGGSRREATLRLARSLGRTRLAEVVRVAAGDPVRLEREAFADSLADQRRGSRLDPLGSAPLLHFLLRLEAQTRDVLRIVWSVSLGASAARIRQELVTPWS